MTTMASQITSLTVVYSTVYSDADQSSASLAFVWGIHRDRWIPRTKGQLRGKCFHLMTSSWFRSNRADGRLQIKVPSYQIPNPIPETTFFKLRWGPVYQSRKRAVAWLPVREHFRSCSLRPRSREGDSILRKYSKSTAYNSPMCS